MVDPKQPQPSESRPDEEEQRERVRGRVEDMVRSLSREGVTIRCYGEDADGGQSDDPADVLYVYRAERILVRDRDIDRVRGALDGGDVAEGLIDGVTSFELPAGLDVPAALERLDTRLGVGVGRPDTVLHLTSEVGGYYTDPEVEPLDAVPIPTSDVSAQQLGRGVSVSVVDTGWYQEAVDWAAWLQGVTGDAETIDPDDIHRYAGHGTFIAGIVRGLAPSAEVRVEGFLPHGGAVLESSIVVQLLDALGRGPDIISLSAGASTRKERPLLSFEVFWESHLRHLKGTVLVAAAGNDSTRVPFWPAAFPWALSVGALDPNEELADFSNFGSWVDVYARGVDLVNAYPKGRFVCKEPPNKGVERKFEGMARWSGSSFSTALVAGLIAARMSRTGDNARQSADKLLKHARKQPAPRAGAILRDGDA
jgi:hypothetical protein